MPHSSNSYYYPDEQPARHVPPRAHSAAAVSRQLHSASADYTLAHAGRQVRVGPVAFWIVVGTLVIMGVWSIGTGTYFAFRDDVLTRLIGRQAEMQFAYEDRIAELRAQVDRITSRQLLDQEKFEKKLEALLQRQAALEQRAATLNSDFLVTGSVKPTRVAPPVQPETSQPPKPSPISDTVILVPPPDREARLQSRGLPEPTTHMAAKAVAGGLNGVMMRVSTSLDRAEHRLKTALNGIEEKYDSRARRFRSVLADLGVNLGNGRADDGNAQGGPLVPMKRPPPNAGSFERQLYRINLARTQIDRYRSTLVNVPVQKPVFGTVDLSSPFGMRMDPFVRGPAIHTGIDMRGASGDPVRATANGKVTVAGWNGGYGKMVEIDHGNGLSTRYGHMSEIAVKADQPVRMGQVIGRIGSTGRSTGPHLHYETRVDGDPVDPQKFLRAGVRLGAL